MQIEFYEFAKKRNSTKLVNVQGDIFNNCELKGTTNMVEPTIIMNGIPANWSTKWNYCWIPLFDRFYFINNWTWVNGVWECSMICDVLASYKTEIGESSEYIARSSFTYNGEIMDTFYPTTTQVQNSMQSVPSFFSDNLNSGFYVVGVIGKESTATQGAITYYQMSANALAGLRAYLLSPTFLQDAGVSNLSDFVPADAVKVIYNPFQYIVSCQWFPLPASAIDSSYKTTVSTMNIGWWTTAVIGYNFEMIKSNIPSYVHSEYITIYPHPMSGTKGRYLDHAPYTTRILRFPPFSEVEVPDEYFDMVRGDKLELELAVDFITGLSYLNLYCVTNLNVRAMQLARLSTKLSVDIQLAQIGIDYIAQHTSVIQHSLDMGNALSSVAGALMGMASPVSAGQQLGNAIVNNEEFSFYDYLRAGAPQLLTAGSNGSLAAFQQDGALCCTFFMPVQEDNARFGRPLCDVEQISDIPGFIMVKSPQVVFPCLETERTMIAQYMATGFFYE